MSFAITRPGKSRLILESPVMAAAGTFGYGNIYADMVDYTKVGAIITNPVTLTPRLPAKGPRMIQLDAGVLVHTGLPNAGLSRTIKEWQTRWDKMDTEVVLHLVATTIDDVQRGMSMIDTVDSISGVELGLNDDMTAQDAADFTEAAVRAGEKPLIVRLPMQDAYEIAGPVADAGAGAIVVAGPPRGTARDPVSGKLMGGRVYGPVLKPLALRMVGQLARRLKDVPIIGAGGVHSPQDARDFIEAGAVAVQVDSVTWVLPRMIEIIGRDLAGLVLTKESGALADEWFTGIGMTEQIRNEDRRRGKAQDGK
jgi:dihydroorotate dehydrogenase (NAD+) catalytic subunit